ncbi:MAG: flagellar basal body rod protein FlgB [Micavibrio sp.]|nr:flagellar basal body rod protein FlgB [Micavibrio sp.]|tara:strand:+ start:5035 stop:5460 length:426 start_codon:yes stop_codon:yes gene_type:complete
MTIEGIGLFAGIEGKMQYIAKSQRITAQNIANANTPHYQAKVLKDVDFGSVLEASLHGSEGMRKLRPETTAPGHMSGGADLQNPKEKAQKITYEIAPDGNAVIIEEQMIRANQDAMDHALMTRIMTKNVGMIRAAVGSSGN